jgi:hypothetical protein
VTTTPAFFWYPVSGGTLETTDLGEDLSDLQVGSFRPRAQEKTLSGLLGTTVIGASGESVRIVLERFVNTDLVWALSTMSAHLERGDFVGFAADQSKAWAAYAETIPTRGDTILWTTGNVWYGSGAVASGDILVIEGLGEEGHREYAEVRSVLGDQITLVNGVKYTYTDEIVLVRHRHFWPFLQWPQEESRKPLLTTVREIHWTLDVTLHTSLSGLALFWEEPP